MAIAGCDLPTFATRLNEVLTLSVPVRTPEKLFGGISSWRRYNWHFIHRADMCSFMAIAE